MSTAPHRRVIEVGPIRSEEGAFGHRVTALVDGDPLWFESSDVRLSASAEGFASALFIPSLHRGALLRLADPVSAEWLANLAQMAAILRGWWRYPAWAPEAPIAPGHPASDPRSGAESTALFFSGGVDSFHRLLRGAPVDWIVTLEGFDFRLDDAPRVAAVDASVRAIAAATGTRSVVVRTNAREHPLVASSPWVRAHGGIMAGIAHLLVAVARRFVIAASAPGDWPEMPWGSHGRIDPLWSSPTIAIAHEEIGLLRIDKVRSLAFEPLVRGHLRVCWQNLEPTGNCGRCAKCLLVMMALEACGELEYSRVFPGREGLLQGLQKLRKSPDRWHTFQELARSSEIDPAIAAAVAGLVRRSRYLQRPDVRTRRAVIQWVFERLPRSMRPRLNRS